MKSEFLSGKELWLLWGLGDNLIKYLFFTILQCINEAQATQLWKEIRLTFTTGKLVNLNCFVDLHASVFVSLLGPEEIYGLQEQGCHEACSASVPWPLPTWNQSS